MIYVPLTLRVLDRRLAEFRRAGAGGRLWRKAARHRGAALGFEVDVRQGRALGSDATCLFVVEANPKPLERQIKITEWERTSCSS